jgi:hypothetical protein
MVMILFLFSGSEDIGHFLLFLSGGRKKTGLKTERDEN